MELPGLIIIFQRSLPYRIAAGKMGIYAALVGGNAGSHVCNNIFLPKAS